MTRIGPGLCFLAILFCWAAGARGSDDNDPTWATATKVQGNFAQWCRVGGHTFILEKTPLADVIRILGRGVLKRNDKDAGGGEWMADYTDGTHLIRFASNAEMGGNDHELEGIEISLPDEKEKLTKLPRLDLPVTFRFGSVGMSFRDLTAALGPAAMRPNVYYEYDGKRLIKMPSGETVSFDVSGSLKATISEGKVVALELFQTTSS